MVSCRTIACGVGDWYLGGVSRLGSLVDYATRSLEARHDGIAHSVIEQRIEEALCLELLHNWAREAELSLEVGARAAAPYYVREAERLMSDHAREAPRSPTSQGDWASARSLSEGFRRFRGVRPHEYLGDRRLDGLRQALLEAPAGQSASAIARSWGYVNLGVMATRYRARFGETPTQTLVGARSR